MDSHARIDDKKTNPGFAIISKKPSFNEYEKAVKQIVKLEETKKILDKNKAYYKGYKNCRGLIGATASIAWSSKNNNTYELISYRKKEKWGSKRYVDDESTKMMDKNCPTTFDNYDYKNNHNRIVPNSPCPVLFGIRGTNEKELINAKSLIKSEEIDSWIIFVTNQGTDDHLQKTTINKIKPYQSVIVKGVVTKAPFTIKGGHVFFKLKNSSGEIDCAAYEPTKNFREIIKQLIVNDLVEVYGGVRKEPLTVNLEKIKLKHLEKKVEKIENPVCTKCGKHMKSIGSNQGYRCIKCGEKSNKAKFKEIKRKIKTGLYEVPVCARRHLSKPIKIMR
jgi:tRNA(Ile2)-agmatinylcytidine synthase